MLVITPGESSAKMCWVVAWRMSLRMWHSERELLVVEAMSARVAVPLMGTAVARLWRTMAS